MFWNKEKTPEELLKEKYLEVMKQQWVIVEDLYSNDAGIRIQWKIYGTEVQFSIRRWEEKKYVDFHWESYKMIYYYYWTVWKIQFSGGDFWESIWEIVYNEYLKQKEEKEKENERISRQIAEEEQRKKDAEFMEEYERLCWSSKEFSQHFKLLEKIENLWKSQVNLMKQWEENQQEIYNTRKEFYSL